MLSVLACKCIEAKGKEKMKVIKPQTSKLMLLLKALDLYHQI